MNFRPLIISSMILIFVTEMMTLPLPSDANNLPVSAQCQAALNRTKKKLQQAKAWSWQEGVNGNRNPSKFQIGAIEDYNNGKNNPWKANRNKMIDITLGEPGIDNVSSSPRFMEAIARDIINSCTDVALIKFWEGYEWGVEVGLLQDGTVKIFECLNQDNSNWGENYPWGYDDCCC